MEAVMDNKNQKCVIDIKSPISIVRAIRSIGLKDTMDQYERRRITLINSIFTVAAISYTMFMSIYAAREMYVSVYILFFGFLACVGGLFLNKKGYNNLSVFLAANVTSLIIFLNALMVKSVSTIGNEYTSLSLLFLAPLCFGEKHLKSTIFSLLFNIGLGFSIIYFDVHEVGMYNIGAEKLANIVFAKYIQASVIIGIALFIFIRERNLHFQIYQEQQLKMINQSRLSDLGIMSAGIAHEINNPLTIIIANAKHLDKQMKKEGIATDFYENRFEKIISSCLRVTKIIAGLRVISRDGSGDPYVKTSAKSSIKNVVGLVEDKFRVNGINLTVSLPETDMHYLGREVQVEQVLVALFSNALDEHRGKKDQWVLVSLRKKLGFCEIRVTDSGPGIPKDKIKSIFKPFYTSKPVGQGTGLGLSVAKGILEQHGGSLKVDTKVENTSFVMEIPLA